MTTAQDSYDRVKLTLQRLNEEWSPIGKTLSHQASMHLRRDWTEGSQLSAILEMMQGHAILLQQFRALNSLDKPLAQPSDPYIMARWEQIFNAATSMLQGLEETLARDTRAKYESRKREYFAKLFAT